MLVESIQLDGSESELNEVNMSKPTFAVAFGAGGARGLAHVHALLAFDELGVRPSAVSGSSMGSLIAVATASGMSGKEVLEFAEERFELSYELLADTLRLRPASLSEFFSDGGLRLGELNVERIMDVFLPKNLPETLDELQIETSIVATDYFHQSDRSFTTGNLRQAVAASSAIPAVFRPVKIAEDIYIDGGITNPVPVNVLAGKAKTLIGIDVAGGVTAKRGVRPGKVEVLYASSQIMQRSIASAMAQHHDVDIFMRPKIGGYKVLDFLKSKEILKATAPFKEEIKAALGTALEMQAKQ